MRSGEGDIRQDGHGPPPGQKRSEGEVSRRQFLKVSATAGGGVLVAVWIPGCGDVAERVGEDTAAGPARLGPYVRIEQNGQVVIAAPCPEIGQGV